MVILSATGRGVILLSVVNRVGVGGASPVMGISTGQITSALSTQNRTLSPITSQRCQLIQSDCPSSDVGHSHRQLIKMRHSLLVFDCATRCLIAGQRFPQALFSWSHQEGISQRVLVFRLCAGFLPVPPVCVLTLGLLFQCRDHKKVHSIIEAQFDHRQDVWVLSHILFCS